MSPSFWQTIPSYSSQMERCVPLVGGLGIFTEWPHWMKLDGQKAFMTGKLKTKGNMMLATKLNDVLKV
jgi:hypothetical protein